MAGVYTTAKKIVWIVIVLFWAGGINIAMSEIKPAGYEYIKTIQGTYVDVDKKIEKALPHISIYELLTIKKLYDQEKENSTTTSH